MPDNIYLWDLEVSAEGFSFADYFRGEREILQPQLEKLGFKVIRWETGEGDSFGPLSRIAICEGSQNVWYG